ncbi:hypothetical protein BDV12DRAFT_188596 [Aspergillus spectabilis]
MGSQVANQFLASGYKVRGTVRDTVKSAWLTALFDGKYGSGIFELVTVKDIAVDRAYDVMKGASVFIHTASIVTFDLDPEKVIPPTIAGALNVGQSDDVTLDEDSYGDELIERVETDLEPGFVRACLVYRASKALAEKAIWDYVKETETKRPDLVANSVLPAEVFGEHPDPVNQGTPSTSAFIPALWNGQVDGLKLQHPKYAIHAQDVGLLHVAGAIHPNANNRRLYGYAHKFNRNEILEILRKQNPGRKLVDNFHTGETKAVIKTRSYPEQLIRDVSGHGWISLEEIVRDNARSLLV